MMNRRHLLATTFFLLSVAATNAAAQCSSIELQFGPGSEMDLGWSGSAHDIDLDGTGTVKFDFGGSCDCDNTTLCDLLSSPDRGPGAGLCHDTASLRCSDDSDCVDPAACRTTLGPPLPIVVDNQPLCVVTVLAGPSSGSIELTSGVIANLDLDLRMIVSAGISLAQPCPRCGGLGAVAVGDTATCQGGLRDTEACFVDAVSAEFGGMSLDCPPSTGSTLTGSGLEVLLEATTGSASLTAQLPCTPPGAVNCHCATCSANSLYGCRNNTDCVEVGLGICTSGDPDVPRRANDCAGGLCGVVATEECHDAQRGHCSDKPWLSCTGLANCTSNGAAGPCILEPRPCFESTIGRVGSASAGGDGTFDSELVAIRCLGRSTSLPIDAALGLPSAGAFRFVTHGVLDQCGDGDVDPGEQCDEGAANGTPAACCDSGCDCKTGTLPSGCDSDNDGLANPCDNCPGVASASALDSDGDGFGNDCDNCSAEENPDQLNSDCTTAGFFPAGCTGTVDPQKAGCCDGGDVCDACPAHFNNAKCDLALSGGTSIGPDGDTLSLDGCIVITVPPLALSQETSISVSVGEDAGANLGDPFKLKKAGGNAVHKVTLLPAGQEFDVPIDVTFCWDDFTSNGIVDTGACSTCLGGRSCDDQEKCATTCTCNGGSMMDEEQLILTRQSDGFDWNGFPLSGGSAQCSTNQHQSAGGCAGRAASCAGSPGEGMSTVAKCCDKTANTWMFSTCDFSELYMGKLAGALIPGGGKADSDCLHEWSVVNPFNDPPFDNSGLPAFKQYCTDGDVTCDADRTANGSCTFTVAACLAIDDPRLFDEDPEVPLCAPDPVDSWELVRPRPDSTKPVDAANAVRLRDAVSAVSPGSVGGNHQGTVTFSPALSGIDLCARSILFDVPLHGTSQGKATLKTRTTSALGVRDSDKLRLTCKPSQ